MSLDRGSSSIAAQTANPAGSEAIASGPSSQQKTPTADNPLSHLRNALAILVFLEDGPTFTSAGDRLVTPKELHDLHNRVLAAATALTEDERRTQAPRRVIAATSELDTNDHGTQISYPVVVLDDGSVLMLSGSSWQKRMPVPGTIAGLELAARVAAIRSEPDDQEG